MLWPVYLPPSTSMHRRFSSASYTDRHTSIQTLHFIKIVLPFLFTPNLYYWWRLFSVFVIITVSYTHVVQISCCFYSNEWRLMNVINNLRHSDFIMTKMFTCVKFIIMKNKKCHSTFQMLNLNKRKTIKNFWVFSILIICI